MYVFRDGKRRDEREFLKHGRDAGLARRSRALDPNRLAGFQDVATIGLVYAHQRLDQRGLATPVFAHQTVNFVFVEHNVDIIIGDNTWEPFGEVPHFPDRRVRFLS